LIKKVAFKVTPKTCSVGVFCSTDTGYLRFSANVPGTDIRPD